MYHESRALQLVLQRLDAVRAINGGFMARCPAHNDRIPSLSIGLSRRGRGVLLHCFAGCGTEDVLSALGLTYGDLLDGDGGLRAPAASVPHVEPPPPAPDQRRRLGRPTAIYSYVDEFDNLLMQVRRWDTPDGKIIRQRRPGELGGWINNLTGVRRVLYRLPEVLQSIVDGQTVYVVEGEKNVEDLRSLGLVATTNPHGAGTWNSYGEEYSRSLEGAHVVLLADNDAPGREHRKEVALSIAPYVATIRIVDLPGLLGEGDDVSDWLARGGAVEELESLAAATLECREA